MPIIQVSILAGRPAAMRQKLLKSLAEATSTSLGVPLTAVRVILTEVAPEHWTVGGEPLPPPKIPAKE